MLNIFYGDMKEAVYNTASYFKYDYEEGWIVDPMVKEMLLGLSVLHAHHQQCGWSGTCHGAVHGTGY